MSVDPFREQARAAIRGGRIPERAPDRTRTDWGRGHACAVCEAVIAASETDYELAFSPGGAAKGAESVHLHQGCFVAWGMERRPPPTEAQTLPARLLVIDDDVLIVDLVTDYFAELGYEVLRALDGNEGLRLVEASQPDAVLLDITMPGKGGEQVLREIRAGGYRRPVIMFSGNGDDVTAVRTLQLGAFDYVAKPFHWDRLQRCVELALVVARVGG